MRLLSSVPLPLIPPPTFFFLFDNLLVSSALPANENKFRCRQGLCVSFFLVYVCMHGRTFDVELSFAGPSAGSLMCETWGRQ